MTGVQTRRTETGYKAGVRRVIEHWIETPGTHWDRTQVNPAGPESRTHNLPWEVFGSVRQDYRLGNKAGGGSPNCLDRGVPVSTAKDRQRALTASLMEQVCQPANLNRAYERVLANKGSP